MADESPHGLDAIEAVADEIATEAMAGLEGLLPPEDYAALQEIISISLAYQPELRRMTRRLAADPEVQASAERFSPWWRADAGRISSPRHSPHDLRRPSERVQFSTRSADESSGAAPTARGAR